MNMCDTLIKYNHSCNTPLLPRLPNLCLACAFPLLASPLERDGLTVSLHPTESLIYSLQQTGFVDESNADLGHDLVNIQAILSTTPNSALSLANMGDTLHKQAQASALGAEKAEPAQTNKASMEESLSKKPPANLQWQNCRASGNEHNSHFRVVNLLQLVEAVEVKVAGPRSSGNWRWCLYTVLLFLIFCALTYVASAFGMLSTLISRRFSPDTATTRSTSTDTLLLDSPSLVGG